MDFFFFSNPKAVNILAPFIEGGAVAHSVERATPGEEVLGSIPAVAALSLLVELVSPECDRLRQVMVSPLCLVCGT